MSRPGSHDLEPQAMRRQQTSAGYLMRGDFMRRSILMLALVAAALWAGPVSAQSNAQLQAGADMTDGMIDMDAILAGLDDQVRTNILIFDACGR
jgi:hypothetical protein